MVITPKKVNYLRLSITDRCNLRCIYCRPLGKDRFIPTDEIMNFEELAEAVSILSLKGTEFVRITGGEPLVRRDVEVLVRMLRKNKALKEISMTTNGILLREKLLLLIQNGLDRLNISLNTFKKDRYKQLTGEDKFDDAWASIRQVLSIPDFVLKINTVILKGITDDEIEDFAAFTLTNKVCVRFIEYFPFNNGKLVLEFVPNSLIRQKIEKRFGALIPDQAKGNGPSENYRIKNAKGQIGFIDTRTGDFCRDCNRLRLTAEGRLYPCLFSYFSINLKRMIREGIDKKEIQQRVDELIFKKKRYSKRKIEKHAVIISDMGG